MGASLTRWTLVLTLLYLPGCPRPVGEKGTLPSAAVQRNPWTIRSYSETVPFTSVTAFDGKIYAGTSRGLVQFEEQTGDFVRLTRAKGLTGDRVVGVADDPQSGLWVVTESGLSRLRDGAWTNFSLDRQIGGQVSAMVATRHGVWVGGPGGLAELRDGKWRAYLPGARINCLLPDMRGDGVWVGTEGEGIHQWDGKGSFVNHSGSRQPLRYIHGLSYTKNAGVVAVGRGEGGDGLVFFDGTRWTVYRPRPAGRLRWTQLAGDRLLLSHGERILVVHEVTSQEAALPPGPVALVREDTGGYPSPRLYTTPFESWLPPDPTTVTAQGEAILIGTRTAGLVRFDGKFSRWYRTGELLGETDKLRVGCSPGGRCMMAGGGGVAYRYGERFDRDKSVAPEGARVETFYNDASGALFALYTTDPGASAEKGKALGTLVLSERQGERWAKLREYAVPIPAGELRVGFARLAPDGALWVGVGYTSHEGESRPWGVAVLRPDGSVLFHRSTLLPSEDRPAGSLALPDDIRDVHFLGDGAIWLATGTGVCRVNGDKVQLFTENEGLASELVYAVTRGPRGQILVATHSGLGRFDGKEWRFDYRGALHTPTRAFLSDGDALWVGTDRGLVKVGPDGKVILTIGSRDGLADERVLDIYRDSAKRIWVLTPGAVSIVAPN